MSQEYFIYIPEKNVSPSKCLTKPKVNNRYIPDGARGNVYFTGDLPNIGSFEINEKTKPSPAQEPYTIENCVKYLEKEAQEFLFHDKPLYFSIKGFETKTVQLWRSDKKEERRNCNLFFWCLNDILVMKYYFKDTYNENFSVYHLNKKFKRCELLLNVPVHNTQKIPLKYMLPLTNTSATENKPTGDIIDLEIRNRNIKDLPPYWFKSMKGTHRESLRLCTEAVYYLRNELADHINAPTPAKLDKLISGYQYFRINDYMNFLIALYALELLPDIGNVPKLEKTINDHLQLRHKAHVDFFCGKPAMVHEISVPELEELIALAIQCHKVMETRSDSAEIQHAAELLKPLEDLRRKDYSGIQLSLGVSPILESDPIGLPKDVVNIVRKYFTFSAPTVKPLIHRLTNLGGKLRENDKKGYQSFLSNMESKLNSYNTSELTKLMLGIDNCYLQGLETSALSGKEDEVKLLRSNFRELIKDIYTANVQRRLKMLHIPSVEAQHIYMKLVEAGGASHIRGKNNQYTGQRFDHALKGCGIEAFGVLFVGYNGFNIFIDVSNELKLNGLLADFDDPYYLERREIFNDLYKEIIKFSTLNKAEAPKLAEALKLKEFAELYKVDEAKALALKGIKKFSKAEALVFKNLFDQLGCTNFKFEREVTELNKAISKAFKSWLSDRSEIQQKVVDLFIDCSKKLLKLHIDRPKKAKALLDKKSDSSRLRM